MTKEEAIRIVRNNWPENRHQLSEALQTLIPELKESEDERIRKEMDSSLVFSEDVNRYLVLISNCGKLFLQYNLVAINYVHELQHALRLC